MNKQKGISSIVVMVAMLVMAVALPVTTKLVQQSQENRSSAAVTDTCSTVHPGGVCSDISNCPTSSFKIYKNDGTCKSNPSSSYQCCVYDGGCNKTCPSGTVQTGKTCTTGTRDDSTCKNINSGVSGCASALNCCDCKTTTSIPKDGSCGTAKYTCSSGTVSNQSETSSAYTWRCNGVNGGLSSGTCTFKKSTTAVDTCSTVHPGGVCSDISNCPTSSFKIYKDDGTCKSNSSSSYQCCVYDGGCNKDCPSGTVQTGKTCTTGTRDDSTCKNINDGVSGCASKLTCCDCKTNVNTTKFWYYNITEAKCKETPSGYTDSSACQNEFLASTKGKTTGQYCYGNESDCQTNYKSDPTVPSTTTYTCSDKACSANYGCMRNEVYTSSTADCKNPIGTPNRIYDVNCSPISDAVLATLGKDNGNNDACKTTTACPANEKRCSVNVLQKCKADGTGWEADTDCGTLGCNSTTKACNTKCDSIPSSCESKNFIGYKAEGDFNCNGTVDINDFNLWKGWFNADKEQCGSITDFSIWKNAFNKSN